MSLEIVFFFVNISSEIIDSVYYACGNPNVAGPFSNGSDAVDWKDEFCPEAPVYPLSSADSEFCVSSPLTLEDGRWLRS